jgi:hypothetical protein
MIIQRGTNHKWVKPRGPAVKFLVCLIDGGNVRLAKWLTIQLNLSYLVGME